MSDFVTELRREVVSAHAQHRVAAVRTRRRRRRPILAGAIALAALLIGAVLVVRSIPQPQQTAEPRVVKVLRIGGNPADGVLAGGSLWVTDYDGRQVLRIDPERGRVIARIPLDEAPEEITTEGGRVWVAGQATTDRVEGTSRIWSLDPATGAVTGRFDTDYSLGIAALDGTVWSARRANGPQAIDQLSPAGRRIRSIPTVAPIGLAAAGRWVWAALSDGTILRIDARGGGVSHRWPRLAPVNASSGDASEAIVPDQSGAWVLDASADRIIRLDGNEVTRVVRVQVADVAVAMARAGDDLWVVTGDDPTAASIARVHPRSGEVTARVDLRGHYPRALVPVPGGLWVIAGDGTVVLVDT